MTRDRAPVIVRIAGIIIIVTSLAFLTQVFALATRSDDDRMAIAAAQTKLERDAEKASLGGREYAPGWGPQIMTDSEIDAALSRSEMRAKILDQIRPAEDNTTAIAMKLAFAAALGVCAFAIFTRRRRLARILGGIAAPILALIAIPALTTNFEAQRALYAYYKGSALLPVADLSVTFAIPSAALACLLAAVVWRRPKSTGPVDGWAVRSARRINAPEIQRTDKLRVIGTVTTRAIDDVEFLLDNQTVAKLPRHAKAFGERLAAQTEFVALDARTWEPAYEWDDVAAILGTFVKVGILGPA